MRILRRLGKFVQKIAVGLRAADQRFVGESLLGLVRRGSTMLTEIGRGLKAPCKLKYTEKRLSRMAKTKFFDDGRLQSNYLKAVGSLTGQELPYVAVDLSDIAKPTAPCSSRHRADVPSPPGSPLPCATSGSPSRASGPGAGPSAPASSPSDPPSPPPRNAVARGKA